MQAVGTLAAVMVLSLALPSLPGIQGMAQYLPLHMALETLAITVAALTFALVWSVRHEHMPRHVLLLGIAFLGVALLDFSHMLSYAGMPDYFGSSGVEKAIAFWLAARLLGTLALLTIALPWTTRPMRLPPWAALGLVLLGVGAVHLLVLGAPHALPRTFIPGQGLTPFKLGAEYFLIALNLLAALAWFWRMRQNRSFNASDLWACACSMAMAGFFFTRYGDVTDIYNLLGHGYKAVAYLFLFRAIFVDAVRQPYRQLSASQQQLQNTLQALPDLVLELDAQRRFTMVHAPVQQELTLPSERMLGQPIATTLPPESAAMAHQALDEADTQNISRGKTLSLVTMQGEERWFELSAMRKTLADGGHGGYVVVSRDITERRATEHTLLKLSTAVEQSPISIVITNLEPRIEYVNAAFTRSSGYSAEEAIGHNPRILQSGKTPQATYRAMWTQLAQGKPWQGELINLSKSGREYVEAVFISPVRNAAGEVVNYLAHKEDITEKKRAAERIHELARHDPLTGLPNRNLLHERFLRARAQNPALAVLWIDLDRFKEVNDTLGHQMGDMLLLEMARRLRAGLGLQDELSRHAGDDFIALLPGADQHSAAKLAEALLLHLAQPMALGGQDIALTGSIGIALCPEDADSFDALLQRAETAMYRVKEEGRNRYSFFTPEMQERSARALALGQALKLAQQRGELYLVYQPQVALADGRLVGAEALLRWDSPQWGTVSPAEFIPLAEASRLIIPLGEWVLREALTQWGLWQVQGLAPPTVAVNLSAVQFEQADLPEVIERVLLQTGVPAHCLELELTEAVAMKHPEAAAQRIAALRRKGIWLSIDDFGTGYSSLSYLKRFKIDKLKIDQSFVRDLDRDADDQAIATAIIELARSLGLATIAEGVETAEQMEWLRARGCEEAQGYHISRPLLPAQFEAFARQTGPAGVARL